jgi:hypothetical protein
MPYPWLRLASRFPIRVFDDHSGQFVTLMPGQSNPGDIEGLVIDFRYTDADGETTRRLLLCWQCGRHNDRLYVRGFCPFREDLRTFRIDRMSDVIELLAERQSPIDEPNKYFAAFASKAVG